MKLKLMSYNCKGFNVSKVPFIKSLLERCDILLLQETWLFSSQLSFFSHFFNDFEFHSICGMDESVIVSGRPSAVTKSGRNYLEYHCRRVCAIKLVLEFGSLYIFNIYMPCDQYSYIDTYIEVLSEILNYCMINNVECFI